MSYLLPRSKDRKRRDSDVAKLHQDGWAMGFDEVRLWLPSRVSDWPIVHRLDFPHSREFYRIAGECWWCGKFRHCEAHHITGGTKGRCDTFTNLFRVCRPCHEEVQSNVDLLGRVLFLKWENDRINTNWLRLNLLAGYWLPDLIAS
jgi:hypothetical protein